MFKDDFQTIRSLAERDNANIDHWAEYPTGGHFAALEVAESVVADLRPSSSVRTEHQPAPAPPVHVVSALKCARDGRRLTRRQRDVRVRDTGARAEMRRCKHGWMVDPRGLLQEMRRETLRRLESLTGDFHGVVAASRDSNADDEHDPEGATIAFERSQLGSLVRQAQDRVAEIDAAIDRLDAGTYAVCEGCGQLITADRLEARPHARTCIQCASSI